MIYFVTPPGRPVHPIQNVDLRRSTRALYIIMQTVDLRAHCLVYAAFCRGETDAMIDDQ